MLQIFLFIASAYAATTFENCQLIVDTVRANVIEKRESSPLQKIGDEDGIVTYRTFLAGRYAYFIHGSGGTLDLSHAPIARDVAKANYPRSFYVAAIIDYLGRGNLADLKEDAYDYPAFAQVVNSDASLYRFLTKDGPRTLESTLESIRYASFDGAGGRNARLVCP